MAMKKYAEYTRQLRALGREAVRIQKAADRVYAKGCAEIIAELKAGMLGKWVCLREPVSSASGMTELSLHHISNIEIYGTYCNDNKLIHINNDDSRLFHFYPGKVKPNVSRYWYEGNYIDLYIEKDFSLWYSYDEILFEDYSRNKYVKKALKYMENNKL